jgi:hypothetical protein
MHVLGIVVCVALTIAALSGCGPQSPPADVDQNLGRACFEAHQPGLPPGSQYEGIAEASETHITIRAMTGAAVETFECALTPDGTVTAIRE